MNHAASPAAACAFQQLFRDDAPADGVACGLAAARANVSISHVWNRIRETSAGDESAGAAVLVCTRGVTQKIRAAQKRQTTAAFTKIITEKELVCDRCQ